VPQLYVGIPDGPTKQLRGFEKRFLQPGATVTVQFPLTRRDLSVWDTSAQKWRMQRGQYKIHVGTSSRDLRLNGTLVI
jgi:beta-glucosidase